MGRKVAEWADSQFCSFLDQPVMEPVPKWARVPTWSWTYTLLSVNYTMFICANIYWNRDFLKNKEWKSNQYSAVSYVCVCTYDKLQTLKNIWLLHVNAFLVK